MNDDVNVACDEVFGCGITSPLEEDCAGCVGCAYVLGAAALGGLIGMAHAIRDHETRQWARGLRPDTSRKALRGNSHDTATNEESKDK